MSRGTLAVVIFLGSMAGASMSAIAQETTSIWSGVYSKAQAERGVEVHSATCAKCHGNRLNGAGWPDQPPSPAIAREGFLKRWEGRPMSELASFIRDRMPEDNPGGLSDQEISDAIAQMLAVSTVPAGNKELDVKSDAASLILIKSTP